MEFKDVLKKLRKDRALSQIELAGKLDVSPGLIGMYETGKRKPSYELLEAIADFFNVSTDYLQGRESGSEYYLDPEVAQVAQSMTSSEIQIVKKLHKLDNDDQLKVEGMIDSYLMDPKYKEKEKLA